MRTALLTGAAGGIGRWTAFGLTQRGYRVLLVCRSAEQGEEMKKWLLGRAPDARVEAYAADLSLQSSVRALAAAVRQEHNALDRLINNAGCLNPDGRLTAEGVELAMAVNYFAPRLLTQELLPLLQRAAAERGDARLINVGSAAADRTKPDWTILAGTNPATPLAGYAQAKFALLTWTRVLASTLEGSGVVAHCLHPGVVGTKIGLIGGWIGLLWRILTPFTLPPLRGALCTLRVACDPVWAQRNGAYIRGKRAVRPNPRSGDPAVQRQLEELSTVLLTSKQAA